MLAFTRFTSRRVTPESVHSYRGTNFVRAERELREGMKRWTSHHVQSKLAQRGVKWIFNSPNASNHGGAWERMIRSFRRIFTALVHNSILNDEAFIAFVAEAERILNDRSIASVSSDAKDLNAITTNALLKGSIDAASHPGVFL